MQMEKHQRPEVGTFENVMALIATTQTTSPRTIWKLLMGVGVVAAVAGDERF